MPAQALSLSARLRREFRFAAALLPWAWAILQAILRRRRPAVSRAPGAAPQRTISVAVDVTPLWERRAGIGWYVDRLLTTWAEETEFHFRLYGPTLIVGPEDRRPAVDLPQGSALEWVHYPLPNASARGNQGAAPGLLARWVLRCRRFVDPLLLAADGADLLFAPNYFPPRRFSFARGRLVASVHDLAWLVAPHTVREETRRDLDANMGRVFDRAAGLMTGAYAVAEEIETYTAAGPGHAPHRAPLTVIHHGPGQLSELHSSSRIVAADSQGASFAFWIGTLEPRKNVGLLLDVWQRLDGLGLETPLWLGGGPGWKSEDLLPRLEAGEASGRVQRLGYLDEAELADCFRHSRLFLFPSLYEGFGLPVLEAASVGRAMVVSDLPVLREVLGDAALFAPPNDVEAWVAAVTKILTEPAFADRLGKAARRRCERFSWQRSGAAHLQLFRSVARHARSEEATFGPQLEPRPEPRSEPRPEP